MIRLISNLLALAWFFGFFVWVVLILLFSELMILFSEIIPMAVSGFAHANPIGFGIVSFCTLVFSITGLVPSFRKCYIKLPWLHSFCMILIMNGLILSLGELILVKGLSVNSTFRHISVVLGVIIQIGICRYLMSWYLEKHSLTLQQYK